MKWVTRERPKIDRVACPWLISRFIDTEPEFIFVPAGRVLEVADETGAVPYDIPDVEMSHEGDTIGRRRWRPRDARCLPGTQSQGGGDELDH
jgi:hypothetical protein